MRSSSRARRAKDTEQQARVPHLPSDIRVVRRCHGALHRFAEKLRGELAEAVSSARARKLGPGRRVEQIGKFVQDQVVAPPVMSPRVAAPPDITISPDLTLSLKYVDAAALAEHIKVWSQSITALTRYEGKPFERKPLATGELKNRPRTAPHDDAEQAGLTALEGAAQRLLACFHAVAAKLERRLLAKPKMRQRKAAGVNGMLTAPEAAKRLGVAPEKLRSWIASGELPATNVAHADSSRPRWRIAEQDLRGFAKSRQPDKARPATRRRKAKPDAKEYF